MKLRLATRRSELALVQARRVAARIEERLGVATELVPLQTSGDRLSTATLAGIGGKGLFVKELEEALLDGRADLAVHSAKDLPARLAPGLCLCAFPERADPRDALVARIPGTRFADLPRGARIGTGSTRRAAQLLAVRPDLAIVPLRGNVPTRLRKLESEGFDALVLACAGLDRLGLGERIDERLPTELLLPAPCQGILAVEVREKEVLSVELAAIGDPEAEVAARAERALLERLEGDCRVPLAGLAAATGDGPVLVRGLVASPDGSRLARGDATDPDPEAAGVAAADAVLAAGGDEILAALRGQG